jgi:hypothetical protein
MSSVANNPQTFLNSYFSAMRNTIITLTLGIGIYGYSKSFNNKQSDLILRLLSIFMYLFSLSLCINTNLMFKQYIDSITPEEKQQFPKYINLSYWKIYLLLGWIFSAVLAIVILLASKRYIMKLF